MPDLLTHVVVALILVKLFSIKKKSLVLLGAVLPDIMYKLSLLGFFFRIPENIFQFGLLPFHSPIGLMIVTIFLAFLFKYPRLKTIALVSLGWVSHLLLDMTNKHYLIKQTYLMLPFSYESIEFGWFWQDEYLLLIVSSIVILAIIYICGNIVRSKERTKDM